MSSKARKITSLVSPTLNAIAWHYLDAYHLMNKETRLTYCSISHY